MLDTIVDPRPVNSPPPRPRTRMPARWACMAALLVVEVLLLTLLIDTKPFRGDRRWWVQWLGWSSTIPRLAAVGGAAILAFGGRKLRAELGRPATASDRSGRPHLFLAGHLAALALFTLLTVRISGDAAGPRPVGGGDLAAWVMAGVATALLWAMAALPAVSWRGLARRSGGVIALGTFVGAGALLMGQWTQSFWNPLSRSTFWAVTHLLRLAFGEVICDPSRMEVGTSTFGVSIAPECSGYEGIGLIWALLLGSFWLFRGRFRFPRAFLLVPIGTALMWVANTLRIAGLVAVGTLVSPRIAAGGFHSQTGWIAFNVVGLGMIVGVQRIPFFLAGAPGPRAGTSPGSTASYLMPLLTLVGSAMITGAFTEGFDRSYPLRMVAVLAAFALYRRDDCPSRPAEGGIWSWEATGIGLGVFALWMALEPAPGATGGGFDPRHELSTGWAAAWLVARVAGSVLIVPLAEELAFRGYLIRRLIAADFEAIPPGHFTWLSLAVSSVAFGALHGRWLAGTLAGACYALALARRGRLGDAVVAHATTNALIAAYVLATGSWSLWS